jgi:hypothetical protein
VPLVVEEAIGGHSPWRGKKAALTVVVDRGRGDSRSPDQFADRKPLSSKHVDPPGGCGLYRTWTDRLP